MTGDDEHFSAWNEEIADVIETIELRGVKDWLAGRTDGVRDWANGIDTTFDPNA
ncbi:hypothetical protein [Fodinicola feengrottensis]|uniref:Uncharacterized protein n=1 Tax=Fodinicola feengrottensis TaxID=435914 RepID=A0ABN2FT80_9ACTN|nr:hypothetical protein [Fodinicola feengrottensis]